MQKKPVYLEVVVLQTLNQRKIRHYPCLVVMHYQLKKDHLLYVLAVMIKSKTELETNKDGGLQRGNNKNN